MKPKKEKSKKKSSKKPQKEIDLEKEWKELRKKLRDVEEKESELEENIIVKPRTQELEPGEEKEQIRAYLQKQQKKDSKLLLILDASEEDMDWLHKNKKEK